MICSKCYTTLEEGVQFCPFCGTKVSDILEFEKKSAAVNDVFDGARDIQDVKQTDEYTQRQPYEAPAAATVQEPAVPQQTVEQRYAVTYEPQSVKAPVRKEKEFFGKGAFVLCLVIIALLSASTGILAYLYLSLLGAI